MVVISPSRENTGGNEEDNRGGRREKEKENERKRERGRITRSLYGPREAKVRRGAEPRWMRRGDAPGQGGSQGGIAKERDEILSRVPPAAHNSVPCGGRNALDSDLVVGGGVGPRRGLEPARLVPHDQRFSISRSRRGSTGQTSDSDAANDENVATETVFLRRKREREREESCTQDNTYNWDSRPFLRTRLERNGRRKNTT